MKKEKIKKEIHKLEKDLLKSGHKAGILFIFNIVTKTINEAEGWE